MTKTDWNNALYKFIHIHFGNTNEIDDVDETDDDKSDNEHVVDKSDNEHITDESIIDKSINEHVDDKSINESINIRVIIFHFTFIIFNFSFHTSFKQWKRDAPLSV